MPYAWRTAGRYLAIPTTHSDAPIYQRTDQHGIVWSLYRRRNRRYVLDYNAVENRWSGTVAYSVERTTSLPPTQVSWNYEGMLVTVQPVAAMAPTMPEGTATDEPNGADLSIGKEGRAPLQDGLMTLPEPLDESDDSGSNDVDDPSTALGSHDDADDEQSAESDVEEEEAHAAKLTNATVMSSARGDGRTRGDYRRRVLETWWLIGCVGGVIGIAACGSGIIRMCRREMSRRGGKRAAISCNPTDVADAAPASAVS